MQRIFRAAALALVAAWGLSQTVVAQTEPQDPQAEFRGEVDVNEVLLDVLVTDNRGNVIIGLGKDDFVVRENGKPVELTGVTFYSNRRLENPGELAKKGVQVDRVPEDRYFVLLFEDQKDVAAEAPRLLSQQMEATQRARDWVEELSPSDWVAVLSYDKKLRLHQDFTRDQAHLKQAIANAMKGKDDGNWPSRIKKDGDGPSLFAELPQGNALRDRSTNIYDAIRLVADAAGSVVGRKNLILFTNGFGRPDSFGLFKPDNRYYPEMSRTLNDNNVAVYPVDLTPATVRNPLADPMTQLATDTGGQYYFNFTNFVTPLRQISEENSGYYLLSYRSEQPAGKAGFQDVDVDVTNPQFRVRARKGYAYGS